MPRQPTVCKSFAKYDEKNPAGPGKCPPGQLRYYVNKGTPLEHACCRKKKSPKRKTSPRRKRTRTYSRSPRTYSRSPSRKSPRRSATTCPVGAVARGVDSTMWQIKSSPKRSKYWARCGTAGTNCSSSKRRCS